MTSEARAQTEFEIWLPDPSQFMHAVPDDVRRSVHLGMPDGSGQGGAAQGGGGGGGNGGGRPGDNPIPIGVVPLGELSPLNPSQFTSGTVRIRIFSPWSFFPPYQISGRLISTTAGGAGDLRAEDVGLGVTRIRARRADINPQFDYDPSTVGKDVDDVPLFLGTVGSLGSSASRTLLYRTPSFASGRYNSFTLVFAVGPQFFSPNGIEDMAIELAITIG